MQLLSLSNKFRQLHLSVFSSPIWVLLALLAASRPLSAQEQIGWHFQQHAGINSISLNPAGPALYPYQWDVNLLALQAFGATDYAYLEDASLLRILQQAPTPEDFYIRPLIAEGRKPKAGSYVVDFNRLKSKGFGLVLTNVMGPSFSLRLGASVSAGIFTRARFWAGTQNIPPAFGYYDYYSVPIGGQFDARPFSVSAISWSETGINFTKTIPVETGDFSIGISVKALQGYEAGYLVNERLFQLTNLGNDSLAGENFVLEGALTTSNLVDEGYGPRLNGQGLGLDLGVIYTAPDEAGGYRWRAGAALLDLARIQFSGQVEQHRINGVNPTSLGIQEYNDVTSPAGLTGKVQLFSYQALRDSLASYQEDQFGLWLPTALSLQGDFHLGSGIFLGAALVQGLPLAKSAPNRGSLLVGLPRLERRWYSVSLPVSLYNWNVLQVGMTLRSGPLVIGTDDLGNWLVRRNLSAGDFYMALKVPFWGKEEARGTTNNGRTGKNKLKTKKSSGGEIKCYKF